jgi:peptidoglycan/xylan/chitin deacetylase (PgdA/CDA1 family)
MKNNFLIDTYAQIKANQKGKSRSYIRSLALDVLSLKQDLFESKSILERPRIQFLYFHHIFKDEAANFEKLVAYLSKQYTFISHSEAVERLASDTIDKPYIAWSSDDGIENNMLAAKILAKYGASCIFYINPASIGLTNREEITEFCKSRLEMPPVAFLNWNQVALLQTQGHEIGNHTYRHSKVSDLTQNQFEEDFIKADDELVRRCGRIKHFAYTYGRYEDFTKEAFNFVYHKGYESCATAVRGCHINGNGPLKKNTILLRRDQIIADWKLAHIEYFLMESAKSADFATNFLPKTYL